MPGVVFNTVTGKLGWVKIPSLGSTIGIMANWTLKRRGDGGPDEGLYDLHASFSYFNPVLFNHPQYTERREITIQIARGNAYRLDGGATRSGKMEAWIEGVKLCRL